jgi:uncharacterized protein (DUF1810 family)
MTDTRPLSLEELYDLSRFVDAQEGHYAQALAEITAGWKQTHWMWFIFPQFEGLGHSAMSRRYAIRSLGEAQAYNAHPVLGPRLRQCAEAALAVEGRSALHIFGSPDDSKLRSCATLFARAAPHEPVFGKLLKKYFGGEPDPRTLALLRREKEKL